MDIFWIGTGCAFFAISWALLPLIERLREEDSR